MFHGTGHSRQDAEIWRRQDLRTPQGNLKMSSRQDAHQLVSAAGESVTKEVIERSFKACECTHPWNLDGSENEVMMDVLNHVPNDDEVDEEYLNLLFDEKGGS